MKTRTFLTDEEKEQIVRMRADGKTTREISAALNRPFGTVSMHCTRNDLPRARGPKCMTHMSVYMSDEMLEHLSTMAAIDKIDRPKYVRRLIEADMKVRQR